MFRWFEHTDTEHTPVALRAPQLCSCWFTVRNSMVSLYSHGLFLHPDIVMGFLCPWLIGSLLLASWVRSILTSCPLDHRSAFVGPDVDDVDACCDFLTFPFCFTTASMISMASCRSLRVVWRPFCTWCWALGTFNSARSAVTSGVLVVTLWQWQSY